MLPATIFLYHNIFQPYYKLNITYYYTNNKVYLLSPAHLPLLIIYYTSQVLNILCNQDSILVPNVHAASILLYSEHPWKYVNFSNLLSKNFVLITVQIYKQFFNFPNIFKENFNYFYNSLLISRVGEIRTHDPLLPKQVF